MGVLGLKITRFRGRYYQQLRTWYCCPCCMGTWLANQIPTDPSEYLGNPKHMILWLSERFH